MGVKRATLARGDLDFHVPLEAWRYPRTRIRKVKQLGITHESAICAVRIRKLWWCGRGSALDPNLYDHRVRANVQTTPFGLTRHGQYQEPQPSRCDLRTVLRMENGQPWLREYLRECMQMTPAAPKLREVDSERMIGSDSPIPLKCRRNSQPPTPSRPQPVGESVAS